MIWLAWLPRAESVNYDRRIAPWSPQNNVLAGAIRRRMMSTPHEEIARFLTASGTDPSRRSSVSLEFARRMSEELRALLYEWEVAVRALEQTKAVVASAADN
jgi:hypothetical protein